MMCLHDLRWWLHLPRLSLGVSLRQVSPDLHFWSDASDVGWGAHLDCQVASGLWDPEQTALSINVRELPAVQLGLFQFWSALQGRTVAVFCDNTTAVTYLRKEGGTRSPLLNTLAQEILRWTESLSIRLAPQFLPGSDTVLADAVSPSPAPTYRVVSKHDRLSIFEKTLAGSNSFICHLSQSSLFDLLLPFPGSEVSRHGRVYPVLGRLSVAVIPRVLAKLRASKGTELTLVTPHWAQRPWFSALVQLSLAPPVFLPSRPDLLSLPRSRHIYPDLRRLRLHAWRHSSELPEPLASPPLARSRLRWRAVHPRTQCIRYGGPFIVGGVTPMAIPFLVLPGLR